MKAGDWVAADMLAQLAGHYFLGRVVELTEPDEEDDHRWVTIEVRGAAQRWSSEWVRPATVEEVDDGYVRGMHRRRRGDGGHRARSGKGRI